MPNQRQPARAAVIFWYAILLILFGTGAILLLFSIAPYSILKSSLDYLAKDGNFARFTLSFYQITRLPFLLLGGLSLVFGIFSAWQARQTQILLNDGLQFIRRIALRVPEDFRRLQFQRNWKFSLTWEGGALLCILLFAVAARLIFLQRGIEYDEAYTYMEFARHSFWQVMSDYSVPNNHVFHTLLVKVATLLFGNAPWAIRIPTFLAGLLILPAAFAVGKQFYQSKLGLFAAGLLAAAPVMVFYSANARGYTLVALFTLLLFLLADQARQQKNLILWMLMILVTGLGFYTIPIMLYPFGIVSTWLLLAGLTNEIDPAYGGIKGWLRYLIGFGMCAAILSVCFYLPIFTSNGILTVFNGNRVVNPISFNQFFKLMPDRLADVQMDWLWGGAPEWSLYLILLGDVLSILLHKRIARYKSPPILLAVLLFLIPFLLIQRPYSLARVWFFLLPLLILTGLAGWAALFGMLRLPKDWRVILDNGAIASVLAAALWLNLRSFAPYWQNPNFNSFSTSDSAALITQYIQENLRAGDAVVVSNDEDARYWYYFDYFKIPETHIRDIKRHYFTRVLLITSPESKGTPEEILRKFGPDLVFLKMETLHLVFQAAVSVVYQVDPNQGLVDRTFGVPPALK